MKMPFVSRARHERELKMLEAAYTVRTADLRERLESLIQSVTYIRMSFDRDTTEVAIRVRLPGLVRENFILSPFEREEYWWHVGQSVVNQLKNHAMSRPVVDGQGNAKEGV